MMSYHDVVIGVRLTMMVASIISDKQIIAESKLLRIYKVIGS